MLKGITINNMSSRTNGVLNKKMQAGGNFFEFVNNPQHFEFEKLRAFEQNFESGGAAAPAKRKNIGIGTTKLRRPGMILK